MNIRVSAVEEMQLSCYSSSSFFFVARFLSDDLVFRRTLI